MLPSTLAAVGRLRPASVLDPAQGAAKARQRRSVLPRAWSATASSFSRHASSIGSRGAFFLLAATVSPLRRSADSSRPRRGTPRDRLVVVRAPAAARAELAGLDAGLHSQVPDPRPSFRLDIGLESHDRSSFRLFSTIHDDRPTAQRSGQVPEGRCGPQGARFRDSAASSSSARGDRRLPAPTARAGSLPIARSPSPAEAAADRRPGPGVILVPAPNGAVMPPRPQVEADPTEHATSHFARVVWRSLFTGLRREAPGRCGLAPVRERRPVRARLDDGGAPAGGVRGRAPLLAPDPTWCYKNTRSATLSRVKGPPWSCPSAR